MPEKYLPKMGIKQNQIFHEICVLHLLSIYQTFSSLARTTEIRQKQCSVEYARISATSTQATVEWIIVILNQEDRIKITFCFLRQQALN